MTSYEMAIALAKALDGKKGQDIKVLKTEELTTLADYFVLSTATSSTQVKAMSDACEETPWRKMASRSTTFRDTGAAPGC